MTPLRLLKVNSPMETAVILNESPSLPATGFCDREVSGRPQFFATTVLSVILPLETLPMPREELLKSL